MSNHHAPYDLGYTRTTMDVNRGKQDLSLIHISEQLVDGSSQLYDGIGTLLDKSGTLIEGIDKLYDLSLIHI